MHKGYFVVLFVSMLGQHLLTLYKTCSVYFQQNENGPPQCGICGDAVDMPRDHERGGKYGSGLISRYYPTGVKGQWQT